MSATRMPHARPRLAMCFASRRPDRLVQALSSLRETTATYDVHVIVTAETEDVYQAATFYADLVVQVMEPVSAASAWNIAAAASTAEWFGLGADDLRFHPGWLDAAWPFLTDEWGVVGFEDGSNGYERVGWTSHYAASRKFCVEHMGGVFVPTCYGHYYVDVETCRIAQGLGKFVYVPDALVEHLHPDWNKTLLDPTYLTNAAKMDADRVLFSRRAMAGFPVAWTPMIEANE